MKNLLLAIIVSTATVHFETGKTYWMLFGEIDSSTETLALFGVGPSTAAPATSQQIILKSPTTPDCYLPGVNPNGSWKPTWVPCPK